MTPLLTVEQYKFLMELIRREYGSGYSSDPFVCRLQGALSIGAEAASNLNKHSDVPAPTLERRKARWT